MTMGGAVAHGGMASRILPWPSSMGPRGCYLPTTTGDHHHWRTNISVSEYRKPCVLLVLGLCGCQTSVLSASATPSNPVGPQVAARNFARHASSLRAANGGNRKSLASSRSVFHFRKSDPFTPADRSASAGPPRSSPCRNVARASTVHDCITPAWPSDSGCASEQPPSQAADVKRSCIAFLSSASQGDIDGARLHSNNPFTPSNTDLGPSLIA